MHPYFLKGNSMTTTPTTSTEDCEDKHCHIDLHGSIRCHDKEHKKFKTELLTIPCAADDPKPQIQNFLNVHAFSEVVQVIDLGHKGWLVVFRHPV